MSQLSTIVHALIYLPPGHTIDSHFAQICLAHIEDHGYKLAAVVHSYTDVMRAFATGLATVAVFARREHWDPEWEPRVEFATLDPCRDVNRPQILRRTVSEGGQPSRPRPLR
jgi:hypothetical protein